MTELNAEPARRAIVEHTRRLAESAAAAGPDAAVPTTPAWTITDLVEHVGQVQHWTAEIIERRITDPTQLPTETPHSPPTPASGRHGCRSPRGGSRARAPMTRSTRRCSIPPGTSGPERDSGCPTSSTRRSSTALTQPTRRTDRPTLTPISQPRSSAIISRCSPPPRGRCSGPRPPMPSGAPGRPCNGWPPTPRPTRALGSSNGGPTGRRGSPEPQQADVTVRGPAQSLLLILTRRIPLTDSEDTNISVDGDTDLAQHWLDNTAHVAD